MKTAFATFLADCQRRSSDSLSRLLGPTASEFAAGNPPLQRLFEASDYSLSGGGKRVRPLLVYSAAHAVTGHHSAAALDCAAAAIEMIHCYSLVHDDLPAMDDDDLRRGRPSCHRAFDEATAILVGDGLQARAFELLAQAPDCSDAQRLAMIRVLAAAAGPRGMVGGQAIDTAAVDSQMDLSALRDMHALKTGALIQAALQLGAIAAGGSPRQLKWLASYGAHIGLAFQVVDDVLDVTGDSAALGKTGGKDADANKPTYVSLLGLDSARAEAARALEQALAALEGFGESAIYLRELGHYIVARDH